MAKCFVCGKEIKYIHNKNENKRISVNPVPVYYVPDDYNCSELFIMSFGQAVKGNRVSDGLKGYVRHSCKRTNESLK